MLFPLYSYSYSPYGHRAKHKTIVTFFMVIHLLHLFLSLSSKTTKVLFSFSTSMGGKKVKTTLFFLNWQSEVKAITNARFSSLNFFHFSDLHLYYCLPSAFGQNFFNVKFAQIFFLSPLGEWAWVIWSPLQDIATEKHIFLLQGHTA